MALRIEIADESTITFEEFLEELRERRLEANEPDQLMSLAPLLKRLGNNRKFLAERILDEMSRPYELQRSNPYDPQVFLLHGGDENFPYLIRACFWPSTKDSIMRSSQPRTFAYEHPHSHNFSFLTIGYHGPGYVSDYFLYDDRKVIGVENEDVELINTGRKQLSPGAIFFYRANVDVHEQHPPESFSISLNIVQLNPRVEERNQYIFDTRRRRISAVENKKPTAVMAYLAAAIGEEECTELLRWNASHAKDAFTRAACSKALAYCTSALASGSGQQAEDKTRV